MTEWPNIQELNIEQFISQLLSNWVQSIYDIITIPHKIVINRHGLWKIQSLKL